MGGGSSKAKYRNPSAGIKYKQKLKYKEVQVALKTIHLSSHEGLIFYDLFLSIDTDNSDAIDLDEFHKFFNVTKSPFSEKVFSALGTASKSRDVPFDDFLINLWNFCTMNVVQIRRFVFDLYDNDGAGELTPEEFDSLVRMLYNVPTLSLDLRKRIKKADKNENGALCFDEFNAFTDKERPLLCPAFDLQRTVQKASFGIPYWQAQTKRRDKDKISPDTLFSTQKLLTTQADEQVVEQKLVEKKQEEAVTLEKKQKQNERSQEIKSKTECEVAEWRERHNDPLEVAYFEKFVKKHRADHVLSAAQAARVLPPERMIVLRQDASLAAGHLKVAETHVEKLWNDNNAKELEKRETDAREGAKKRAATKMMGASFKKQAKDRISVLKKDVLNKNIPKVSKEVEAAAAAYIEDSVAKAREDTLSAQKAQKKLKDRYIKSLLVLATNTTDDM